MNGKISKLAAILAGAVVMASLAGCVRAGETRIESQQVELGAANSVRMHVAMGAGELKLSGGAEKLLKADFTYNVDDWKPQVRYTVAAGNGDLEVKQPASNDAFNFAGNDARNQWDLAVNNNVPLDLAVDMGAGTSDLDLSNVNVSSLDMNLGAGKTTVDLSGSRKMDITGDIKGGAGKTTVVLPEQIGVRVVVHGGIGTIHADGLTQSGDTYENASYSKGGPKIHLTVESGVGEISLTTSTQAASK